MIKNPDTNPEDLERELLLQRLEQGKNGNTGITGGLGDDGDPGGPRLGLEPDGAAAAGAVAVPGPDRSAWNTDGYDAPKVTAANFGSAVGGFDQGKWADANHQTPKYVVGRILQEAAGGTGALQGEEQRNAAVAKVLEAYPGSKFDGKDKITFPDGGTVDVFTGAGAGQYGIAWQPQTGPGGAALEGAGSMGGGSMLGMDAGGASSLQGIQGLMPTDTDFYKRLQDEVSRTLGGSQTLERDELLKMLTGGR